MFQIRSVPGADCAYVDRTFGLQGGSLKTGYNYFGVSTRNWPSDPRGCGRGVLDNIRGQTTGAEASHWNCRTDILEEHMNFRVSTIYPDAGPRVAEAIRLASPGGNVTVECKYTTEP